MYNGNTINTSRVKRQIIGKTWCFTINNWENEEYNQIKLWPDVSKGVVGKEVGEKGTPHLQGAVTFKKAMTLTGVKKLHPTAHWEKANQKDKAFTYCLKDGKFEWWKMDQTCLNVEDLYDWQKEIWDLCLTVPDDRTIHWYWEPDGCCGKTALVKMLCLKQGGFLFGGSEKDIASRCLLTGAPRLCLMNLCRTSEGRISFSAIEALKDGLIQSGKYEGGQMVFNSPHVIIFANYAPDMEALSVDRWNITRVNEDFGF